MTEVVVWPPHTPIVMAGLDPATHPARVHVPSDQFEDSFSPAQLFPAFADANALGGRVKPGHDE